MNGGITITEEIINRDVLRLKTVLVIDENGTQLGVMPAAAALSIAENKDLDLVCVAPTMSTPVCKILNYGKYKFEQKKREKAAKKKLVNTETKEIQITATIAEHDMETKAKKVKEFLEEGDYVRIVMRLRGREANLVDYATEKFDEFVNLCGEFTIRKPRYIENRDIIILLEKKRKS